MLLTAQRQFRIRLLRIGENTRLLESWRAGDLAEGSREWRLGEILDHLARTGDVPHTVYAERTVNVKEHDCWAARAGADVGQTVSLPFRTHGPGRAA